MQIPYDQVLQDPNTISNMVGALDPSIYEVGDQVVAQAQTAAPEMARALMQMDQRSFYEGQTQDFATKRLRIALQRKREKDVYAFV